MKKLFIYIMMMMPLVANADTVEINGIYYNLISKNNVAEVTSNPNRYSGTITIPSSVTYEGKQYNVTSIGDKAFQTCYSLESVTISNGIVSIGNNAFDYCTSLTSVEIPNSVKTIGNSAFIGCAGLTTINIPNSVTTIGGAAFTSCKGLVSIAIPNNVTEIKSYTFMNCSSLTTFVIPDGVKTIGGNAFQGCSGLTSITIPNNVSYIEGSTFEDCSGLTSATIGSGVKSIYSKAFYGCKNLMDVYCMPESVPSTNSDAFKDSYQENITLHVPGKSIDDYKAKEPWSKFKDIVDLNTISPDNPGVINNPVEINGIYYNIVPKAASAEVTSNPNRYSGTITIPSSVTYEGKQYNVTSIGDKAFQTCYSLESVTISNGIVSIGNNAFDYCTSLTSVEIPNSVKTIGNSAFIGCAGLTTINIPNSVTTIGGAAFTSCKGLVSIAIPNNVTEIKSYTFMNCSSLTTFVIPDGVKTIGGNAFQGCSGLTSITIPNNVSYIEGSTFEDCSGLTSATIGSGVKSIYSKAFYGCKNLMDVYCMPESVPSTNSDAFKDSYQESITLHVPAKSINAYKDAEPWNKFYEIVAIEGIVEPESPKCATPEIKFSDDTFTFSCATQGVEFVSVVTVSDAKKYYDAKIKLAQTYKISVYATKNGYERSDIATKEIVITNDNTESAEILTGDVNGDGVVNVADHVKLSDIIMKSKGSMNGKK